LRRGVDEYLRNISVAGQRILEIGHASGFLSFEMEKRCAEVVLIEVTTEHGWNFVSYPPKRLEEVFGPRGIVIQCRLGPTPQNFFGTRGGISAQNFYSILAVMGFGFSEVLRD